MTRRKDWGWMICLVLLLGGMGAHVVEAFPTRPYADPTALTSSTGVALAGTNTIGAAFNLTASAGNNIILNKTGGTNTVYMREDNGALIADFLIVSPIINTDLIQPSAGTNTVFNAGGGIRLSSEAAKPTCDSSIPGTLKYEVVANVGTGYICRQTGVGTFAWAALH